jgi:peptidoglycan/LPS O-acetylase OafA/YrhL
MLGHFLAVCKTEILAIGPAIGLAIFKLASQGGHGVDLFFVLSGFLITGILVDTRQSKNYFTAFYGRRFLRIFPVYYLTLLVTLVVLPRLLPFSAAASQSMIGDQVYLWCYAINIPPFSHLQFFDSSLNFVHFWSLAVEEHFYIFWPLIVYLLPKRMLALGCCIIVMTAIACRSILSTAGADSWTIGTFTLCRVDSLAIGGLVAILFRSNWQALTVRLCKPILAVSGILFLLMMARPSSRPSNDLDLTIMAVFFACALVFAVKAAQGSLTWRFLNLRALRYTGQISYGLYIFHFLLLGAFSRALPPSQLKAWTGSNIAAVGCFCLLATALSFLIASLSLFAFEKQLLKFKRFFEYRRV